jgi:uncharacterized repeat protein (TIGR01451 family)
MTNRCGRTLLIFSLCLSGVLMFSAAVSWAQPAPRLDLKTTVEKEVKTQKNGKWVTEMVPADKTSPGDILVYIITYQNEGKLAAVDAQIVNPIPQGIVYRPDTGEGQDAEITFSIDNSRTWHKPPIMIQVKKPDGTVESKSAPAERYTHIRWVIKKPVQPGQSGRVSFKATVR